MTSPAWFAWLADDATRSLSFRSPAWSTTWLPARPGCPGPGAVADLNFSVEEAATFLGAGMGYAWRGSKVAALVESLTERELEVLRLLAAGRSNAGIAPSCSWSRALD